MSKNIDVFQPQTYKDDAVFTEYKDTLEYLRHHLENHCGEDRIM